MFYANDKTLDEEVKINKTEHTTHADSMPFSFDKLGRPLNAKNETMTEEQATFFNDLEDYERVEKDQRTNFLYVVTHEVRTTEDKNTMVHPLL